MHSIPNSAVAFPPLALLLPQLFGIIKQSNSFIMVAEAWAAAILKPAGLSRVDGKRPDGATVLLFSRGFPMAWDATIVYSCASSNLHATASSAGAAAASAEDHKRTNIRVCCHENRVNFQPFCLETVGLFGPSVQLILTEIAARISVRTVEKGVQSRLHRQIASAVQTAMPCACLRPTGASGWRNDGFVYISFSFLVQLSWTISYKKYSFIMIKWKLSKF